MRCVAICVKICRILAGALQVSQHQKSPRVPPRGSAFYSTYSSRFLGPSVFSALINSKLRRAGHNYGFGHMGAMDFSFALKNVLVDRLQMVRYHRCHLRPLKYLLFTCVCQLWCGSVRFPCPSFQRQSLLLQDNDGTGENYRLALSSCLICASSGYCLVQGWRSFQRSGDRFVEGGGGFRRSFPFGSHLFRPADGTRSTEDHACVHAVMRDASCACVQQGSSLPIVGKTRHCIRFEPSVVLARPLPCEPSPDHGGLSL